MKITFMFYRRIVPTSMSHKLPKSYEVESLIWIGQIASLDTFCATVGIFLARNFCLRVTLLLS